MPSLEENDPSAPAVMAGLHPATQTRSFRDWPGMPTRVRNNATWHKPDFTLGQWTLFWWPSAHT
jgi:hypothetical protein